MAGERTQGPLQRDPFAADPSPIAATRGLATAGPAGLDTDDAVELDTAKKISKVTKDWTDPPCGQHHLHAGDLGKDPQGRAGRAPEAS